MAADQKPTEYVRKRSTSVPKATLNVMTSSTIPVIIVENKKDTSSTSPSPELSSGPPHQDHLVSSSASQSPSSSSPSTTVSTTNTSSSTKNSTANSPMHRHSNAHNLESCPSDARNDAPTPTINIIHPSKPQKTVRSSSDIGIPAASMPNLAFQLGGGELGAEGGGENYLGVYCSPRTTRRSVDLDFKESTLGHYDWMETLDSSANSLKVLTSSSRVGSALSLNSECTTRSIGLLSNDSDSEEFSQSDKPSESSKSSGQGQLRRYLSYPEEGQGSESSTRPSQSLSNLKSANNTSSSLCQDRYLQRQSLDYSDVSESTNTLPEKVEACGAKVAQDDLAVENIPGEEIVSVDITPTDRRKTNVVTSSYTTNTKRVIGSVRTANNNNMLCYKYDTNSPSRDGRIRQWLQDMDTTDNEFMD